MARSSASPRARLAVDRCYVLMVGKVQGCPLDAACTGRQAASATGRGPCADAGTRLTTAVQTAWLAAGHSPFLSTVANGPVHTIFATGVRSVGRQRGIRKRWWAL